jgi:hypothetical protein
LATKGESVSEARFERRYGFDAAFDLLDRAKLLDLISNLGYGRALGVDNSMTRAEMIDLLISTGVEAEYDAEEDTDEYPLRRVFPCALPGDPALLERRAGCRVHLNWVTDWRGAVDSLVADPEEFNWGLPSIIKPGDLIIFVLDCDPALVVCTEVVGSVERGIPTVQSQFTFTNPITWLEVNQRLSTRPPRKTRRLTDAVADELLVILRDLVQSPSPAFVTAGDCTWNGRSTSSPSVEVARLLQDHARDPERRCSACDAPRDPGMLQLHYFRPVYANIQLEIQDHIDDSAMLCDECHRLAHAQSLQVLRRALRPSCPSCGARNPRSIQWGFLAEDRGDDVIVGGCVVGPGIWPQWMCRDCETAFVVTPIPQGQDLILSANGHGVGPVNQLSDDLPLDLET